MGFVEASTAVVEPNNVLESMALLDDSTESGRLPDDSGPIYDNNVNNEYNVREST